ncbi:MAG: hypothetical protein MJ166_05550 [Clostridia bacterium]|nr:hypothetical protein [Clostridia bacterium]
MSKMEVTIWVNSNCAAGTEAVIEDVKEAFGKHYPDKNIEWTVSGRNLATEIDFGYGDIKGVFQNMIDEIPDISDVYATYSYSVREDDSSAEWWGTSTVCSQKVDGKLVLIENESTGWN